ILDSNSYEQVEIFNEIGKFIKDFKKYFFGNYFPYFGCEKVCSNNTCIYRHHVLPLFKDKELLKDVEAASKKINKKEQLDLFLSLCYRATRRVLLTPSILPSSKIPNVERRKVGLCFAIHMGEVLPGLDIELRNNLLNLLLPSYMASENQRV
ncbi:MAG: hypothetical protein SAJ12_20990, partial [Jaaginema sp. PMC 1079.18]|nr:hypothetical protein [Jaaginema sp. PMC 1079.18]